MELFMSKLMTPDFWVVRVIVGVIVLIGAGHLLVQVWSIITKVKPNEKTFIMVLELFIVVAVTVLIVHNCVAEEFAGKGELGKTFVALLILALMTTWSMFIVLFFWKLQQVWGEPTSPPSLKDSGTDGRVLLKR